MRHPFVSVVALAAVAALLAACGGGAPQATPTSQPEIANPASQNCIAAGGSLEIRQRSDGGQYGVCLFEDNRQCEEWAFLRGDCPAGGVRVTGLVTPAAQFCAITGGQYAVTGNSNTETEQGTCTLPGGTVCDAWAYYEGTCGPASGEAPPDAGDPFAYCAEVGTLDTPDARFGPALPEAIVQGMVRQGIVVADAPADFQDNAVWRCMDGQVWVCHFGANLPCLEKADASQEPSEEMKAFCTANPDAEVIPAAVTGRATVYEWTCAGGQPQAGRQVLRSDAQGFLADFWMQLTPP